MIRIESAIPDPRDESRESERMGFIALVTEQDNIRRKIEEVQLQIQSLEIARKAGDVVDTQRLESLKDQLTSAEEELSANEIALGRLETPILPL